MCLGVWFVPAFRRGSVAQAEALDGPGANGKRRRLCRLPIGVWRLRAACLSSDAVDENHKRLVAGLVAARKQADELADLYVGASAHLLREHGPEAATEFLERLRDSLVSIRPFAKQAPSAVVPVVVADVEQHNADSSDVLDWDGDLPRRCVLVDVGGDEVERETAEAIMVGGQWLPKSQLWEVPEVGVFLGRWPLTKWLADKKDLEVVDGD